MSLEPIDPETALDLYLTDKETDLADASLKAHNYRLQHLVRWCDQEDIENLNVLSGRKLHEYHLWRREDGDLSKVSEKTQMDTLRVFVRWLGSIDAVEQDLQKKVRSPGITPRENSRDVMLETDDAETMLAYLERYEHASLRHVTATLRIGSLRALDVEDYDPEEQSLRLQHRPDTDTPPKNKGSRTDHRRLERGVSRPRRLDPRATPRRYGRLRPKPALLHDSRAG